MYTNNIDKKVLIVDDHTIIRRGLKFILESNFGIHHFLETESCKGLLQTIDSQPITHMILDMQLTDGNVIEFLSRIINRHPEIRILIYTMSPEEIFGVRLMTMGVAGFLNKNSSEQEVVKALDVFFRDQKYMSQFLHDQMETRDPDKSTDPFEDLSQREMVVLNYLLKGNGIKEISAQMNLKTSTVATFKARIYNKLGVSNLIDLKNLAEIYKYKQPVENQPG